MGVELTSVVGDVDESLICPLCNMVLLDPVMAHCQHVFCQDCVSRKRLTSAVCPVCSTPFIERFVPAPRELQSALQALEMRCNLGCGGTCTIGGLAEHMEECPLLFLDCPYKSRGCKDILQRRDMAAHLEDCNFRYVDCEACGHRTLFCDLFTHQKAKKCMEQKLKREVVDSVRRSRGQVRCHRKELTEDIHYRDQQQRRWLKSRLSWSRPGRGIERSMSQPAVMTLSDWNSGQVFLTAVPQTAPSGARPDTHLARSDSDLTTMTSPDDRPQTDMVITNSAPVIKCRRCNRRYREAKNHSTACCWHQGPVVELFGGTCQTCGRLDTQEGCLLGYHIA
ncbi:PREDICTED: RING finger protein 151-like [Branchiostoma belcheri]|uniref:RING finger protein 151-like n=1 Tax=Branchiostoma belcheri TaxID=7741 RepID=A0A6P5ADI6_BRABE|nr:PREDICTED: RING finger protein 151-like [Branchiostoma belcheri]